MAVSKLRKISLSDHTTKRRCDDISKDLLKQLVIKVKKSPAYGLQLDETTDILDDAQMIFYCRFVDAEAKTTVEHYLCCVEVCDSATTQSMFDKLNEFLEEHDLDWTKCKSVTTDGATQCKVLQTELFKNKKVSLDCISNHCIERPS